MNDDSQSRNTLEAVQRFNDAFGRRDLDGVMAAMTVDCLFEGTVPPDGVRHEGQAAVRAYWEQWFARNPDARFETEETIVVGDRCVALWVYRKTRDGKPWHLRGIDVFRVRDGKVAEKLSYVKG